MQDLRYMGNDIRNKCDSYLIVLRSKWHAELWRFVIKQWYFCNHTCQPMGLHYAEIAIYGLKLCNHEAYPHCKCCIKPWQV